MTPRQLLLVTALSLPFAQHSLAADAPPVEARAIADNLYLVTGGGGANSVALTGPEGTLVVDAKLNAASAEQELAVLGGLKAGPVRFLVNTHVHPDHTGGNETYGRQGAVIIARDETRSILAAGQRGGPPAPAMALPTLTFDASPVTLHLNGETVVIRPMAPAHTTDNTLVQFVNADVYQLGDIFGTYRYPVLAGGTFQGFIDDVGQVLAMADEKARFIPGNGDIEDIANLRQWHRMLVSVRDKVSALVRQGLSLDEVKAAKPTADFDATYGSPDRMLPALYRELGGK